MKAEIEAIVTETRQSFELLRRFLDWDNALKSLDQLNAKAEDPDLWSDRAEAQRVMRERTRLEHRLGAFSKLEREFNDNLELLELAEAEGDQAIASEAEKALLALRRHVAKLEIESLLSGEADGNDCFLEVHAGAGGTESQDWAEMLARMYLRWAEAHDYKVQWIEESPGEEAGLKSATLRISGPNAYGWLKTESGVHRLVRISPYDSASRRHTSFASVGVYPVIDETIEVEVNDKDLRVDTYRASGAGGQHVNKTDSAVRLTHLPTGIVVQCQNDRSQHRNRAAAMDMLRARLYELELQKREEQAQNARDARSEIGWGHQIRSYVLHPYQMVKDLRTGVEKGNAQGVLDGDLDDYLAAALSHKIGGAKDSADG
ncbi:MAG: peptide chain release factor 2 [Alphaproteobacteria bacterium]|nr:peptide chain release factor 2 [Alphaproteobacteria bacterium]MCZ6813427.1 peptide chain release factor 2 [Alphaproteobacteria bacterium]